MKYKLATDDVGRTHIVARVHAICGRECGPIEAVASTDKGKMSRMLTRMPKGCMDCVSALTGIPKHQSRSRVE